MTPSRPPSTRPSRSRFVGAWAKVSEYLYVHVSGARIERRGLPEPQGWYLIPANPIDPSRRFEPTPQGCDSAFVAFAGEENVRRQMRRLYYEGQAKGAPRPVGTET
jgi:hypothetical protein